MNTQAIIDAVVSHAAASGYVELAQAHEPKSKPIVGGGVTAAVWVQQIGPVPAASGLSMTSGRLELTVRLYAGMLSEPQDAIDPNMMAAVDALMAAYSGDFDLGGSVRNVDLLGSAGVPLQARAGYLAQDGKLFRVFDICLPLILSDIWAQVA